MGLSDITVLLDAIHRKTGLVTFHSGNPTAGRKNNGFDSGYAQEQFRKILVQGVLGEISPAGARKRVRAGRASGKLVGGNLNCLLKLAGTEYFPQTRGRILFLEVFSTPLSETIFKLTQLRNMGVFNDIVGCVVGYCYSFEHDRQFDVAGRRVFFEDVLKKLTADKKFPILKVVDFGHRVPNTFLPIGGEAVVDADKRSFALARPYLR